MRRQCDPSRDHRRILVGNPEINLLSHSHLHCNHQQDYGLRWYLDIRYRLFVFIGCIDFFILIKRTYFVRNLPRAWQTPFFFPLTPAMNYLYLYSVFIFGPDLAEIGNPHPGARSARRALIFTLPNTDMCVLFVQWDRGFNYGDARTLDKKGDSGTSWACSFAWGTTLEPQKIIWVPSSS